MITRLSVVLLIGWLLAGAAVAAANPGPATDPGDDLFAPRPGSTPAVAAAPRPQAPPPVPAPAPTPAPANAAPVLSGNPLWAIPLRQLTAVRARPLFAPSRRPPSPAIAVAAPAAAAPSPKPAEPDKPPLALVGTVTGHAEAIGLFMNPTDRSMVRLKAGEAHKGWVLRLLRPRQAVLAKGLQTAVLELLRDPGKAGPMPPVAPAAPANRAPEAAADKVATTPSSSPIDPSTLTATAKPAGGLELPTAAPGSAAPAVPPYPFRNTRLR